MSAESQRAMCAAELANLKHGQRADAPIGASTVTQSDAAALLKVSRRQVQRAKFVREAGVPIVVVVLGVLVALSLGLGLGLGVGSATSSAQTDAGTE